MVTKPPHTKRHDRNLSLLDGAIEALNLVKEASSIAPAKAVFGLASSLLTMIRDSIVNERDYVELGLASADVCKVIDRGLNGRQLDDLNRSMLEAVQLLTAAMARVQLKVAKKGRQHAVSRLLHAKSDKETINTWRFDLIRVLHLFHAELAISTNVMVTDICRDTSVGKKGTHDRDSATPASVSPGELPPQPPRVCFGRDELVEEIVGLAENHKPVALVGAAGIGKTSIALTVLHHPRIKERYGDNRHFIRCDQFPASYVHFLARLSRAIGAGVKNPESLTPLRPILSSREIVLFLDNSESILDPQGTDAQKIHAVVEELSRFSNVCLGITSRISIALPHCERPVIPVLSMEAACSIFYSICDNGGHSDVVNDLVQRLDYHALSITLLATTASRNCWDYDELSKEWDTHGTQALRTDYNQTLAATIELSLASPTFRKLGPDAPALLAVIAFFPQGIDKNKLDWLFPTIPDRKTIFNEFRALSLTHRHNDFFTMLAPIREYLCPRDLRSSPLLRATKDRYFERLSAPVDPELPNFSATRWIMSEDVNVEHLIDVFISIDAGSEDVWDACERFMLHLSWHKVRIVTLGSKIEALPDDHPSKRKCFFQLSKLFKFSGNFWEHKRLVTHLLELEREGEDGRKVAHILGCLADTNRILGFCKEGIAQAKEASEIFEGLGDTSGRVLCLHDLACLLYQDVQLDAAKETAARALTLLPNEGAELLLCQSHHLLGYMCFSKGEREKAIHHFGVALGIASSSNWHHELGGIYYSLATLFLKEDRFENALDNVKKAQLHTADSIFHLGRATELEARVWYRWQRSREATAAASRALEIFEQLGAVTELGHCRDLLRDIGQPKSGSAVDESGFSALLHWRVVRGAPFTNSYPQPS